MFDKVLVANRGEIAVRLLRTLREMGIASVAVYSDADHDAPHWRLADEAYGLGNPMPSESYLSMDKILDVARRSGAQAILPGYGFLSENAQFAKRCAEAGLVFVGPRPEVIDMMGDKQNARRAMIAAGVPVVPGGPATTREEAVSSAATIGYPVLIKAAAGGGGRGMRVAEDQTELGAAFEMAQSEAKRAFGSADVYLEKYLPNARHVEVQVLGDEHGNVVHLYERDCSVQRRHQKLIEETPCPSLDEARLGQLYEAALRGARAVDYSSAGTFEFLVTPEGEFFFIEMNTRLQVEHTITELVTGVDLVRSMLEVAAGIPLPFTQSDIPRRGAALQCRICAENPRHDFAPSAGRVFIHREPTGPSVRLDWGVSSGQVVSTYYDSLLGKLCVWAPTRERALATMRRALSEYSITGLATNLEFHERALDTDAFRTGHYDTRFVSIHPHLLESRPLDGHAIAAAVLCRHLAELPRRSLLDTPLSRWAASARPGWTAISR